MSVRVIWCKTGDAPPHVYTLLARGGVGPDKVLIAVYCAPLMCCRAALYILCQLISMKGGLPTDELTKHDVVTYSATQQHIRAAQ